MTLLWEEVCRQTAQAFQAKTRRWATPGELAKALDPTTVQTPALDLIDRELVGLADGDIDRLMVFMPPQEGKSVRVSHRFAQWMLINNLDMRIAIVSYADEIARRWGSDIKLDAQTFDGSDDTVDLGLRLRADSRAAGRWQIEGRKGGVYCVGVAGSLTGKPVDCMRGDTEILTEFGYARIGDIHEAGPPFPRVLSWNHENSRAEWRSILASRAITDRPLVEIHTTSGRVIRCTPDHRIYVAGRGYVPAADLEPGARLLTAGQRADHLRELCDGVHPAEVLRPEDHAGDPDVLRSSVPEGGEVGHPDLRRVRHQLQPAALRSGEGQASGLRSLLLHEALLPGHPDGREAAGCPAGRVCAARPADHLGRTADRDRPPGVLQRRDRGAVRRGQQAPGLRELRQDPQIQERYLPGLLSRGSLRNTGHDDVLAVRARLRSDAGREREEEARRADGTVLLGQVSPRGDAYRWSPVLALQSAERVQRSRPSLLLPRVPGGGQAAPALPDRLRVLQRPDHLLLTLVRERGALAADDRCRELALQGRHQLRRLVPQDAPADPGAGPEELPGVRAAELPDADRAEYAPAGQVRPGDPSPERGPGGQPAGEPDRLVRDLPCDPPQVGYDTVSVVRHLHGQRDTVYDLQVDGNRNFFAGQILVHNCLIIDDPIKDLEQAQSSVYRERAWRFWQAVAVPRLGPGSRVVIIQTRWHESDLGGRLLAQDPARWRVVSIPAVAESADDPLGRRIGEPMISARGRRDWAKIRSDVGEYVWASLYQQRPAPAEGGLFKRAALRHWTSMPADPTRHGIAGGRRLDLGGRTVYLDDTWRFITADLAASTKTSADYTVAGVWAISLDGDLILLDAIRERMDPAGHWPAVRGLRERWAADTVYVESRMFGTTLVYEAGRAGVPVVELHADTDKVTRALPATARADSGRLWLPPLDVGPWVQAFIDELLSFPNAAHDDCVDVTAYAARVQAAHWVPDPGPARPARSDGAAEQAYAAATGHSAATDPMAIDY